MGEPMIVPLHRKGRVIFDASQRPVAGLSGFGSEDDAEIFVLSVNACAGISKETLAAGPTLAEVIRMRKQEYDKLRAEREELIKAGNVMRRFIMSWRDCLEGVQMTEEDFVCDCGIGRWNRAALAEKGE